MVIPAVLGNCHREQATEQQTGESFPLCCQLQYMNGQLNSRPDWALLKVIAVSWP